MGQVLPGLELEFQAMLVTDPYQAESLDAITLFSQARFVNAIVKAMGKRFRPIRLPSEDSRSAIFGVETLHSFGRRSVHLAPYVLYAHPFGTEDLGSAVGEIVARLKTFSTATFDWNVRFDHGSLAQKLISAGIPCSRHVTHALLLQGHYEKSFARFSSTTRNLVRRAKREGIVAHRTEDPKDLAAYYEVHKRLAAEKGNYDLLYPKTLFDELLKLRDDVVFVVAKIDSQIAGGAWFYRDGKSMFYWHAAMDRKYSRRSPAYAIVDYAIGMAHEEGRSFFNFGGSRGIASLLEFKTAWGAEEFYCWHFHWQNPVWQRVGRLRRVWRLHA